MLIIFYLKKILLLLDNGLCNYLLGIWHILCMGKINGIFLFRNKRSQPYYQFNIIVLKSTASF